MSRLYPAVLSLIENDILHFEAVNMGESSMRVEAFESNFGLLAAVELPDIGQFTYYYRNHSSPNLVMCIKVANNRLRALLGNYDFFAKRIEPLLNG